MFESNEGTLTETLIDGIRSPVQNDFESRNLLNAPADSKSSEIPSQNSITGDVRNGSSFKNVLSQPNFSETLTAGEESPFLDHIEEESKSMEFNTIHPQQARNVSTTNDTDCLFNALDQVAKAESKSCYTQQCLPSDHKVADFDQSRIRPPPYLLDLQTEQSTNTIHSCSKTTNHTPRQVVSFESPAPLCALIGLIFSWIPVVGLANYFINRRAPQLSQRWWYAHVSLIIALWATVSALLLYFIMFYGRHVP
jgi:hypothetical protein